MCSLYPATVLQMQNELGVIKDNARASMLVLGPALELLRVIEK
jgi:N-acetylglucosamine-6-phosphate deacetylase